MISRVYSKLPQHLKVTVISWLSRGVFVIASLYNVKQATTLLNVSGFAVYAILTNIVTWLLLSDFGIGFSIQNFISEARARNKNSNYYAFTGLIVTFIFAIILVFVAYFFSDFFAEFLFAKVYANNLNNSHMQINSMFFSTCVLGIITGCGMVSHKIFYSWQKGYLPNILSTVGVLSTLIALALFKSYNVNNIRFIILAFFVPNFLVTIIPAIYIFIKSLINILPHFNVLRFKLTGLKIIGRGLGFFVFTTTSAITLQVDYLVMSQTVSANEISIYNILFKIYSAFFLVYTTLLLALWPSIAEWYTQKKAENIYSYCKKYIIVGIVFMLGVSSLFLFNKTLVLNLISNINFDISNITIGLFTLYFCLRVWTDTFAIVLQSTSNVKSLWVFTPVQAIVSFLLQIILSKMYGINGILIALIMSFLLTVAWGLPYQVRKVLKFNFK